MTAVKTFQEKNWTRPSWSC